MLFKLDEIRASIAEMAEICKSDDLMAGSIRAMLAEAGIIDAPQKWERPAACPTAIAAAELAVFDNWKGVQGKKKGKPYRYGLTLKVWLKGARIDWKKPSFAGTVTLFDSKTIAEKATDLKRKTLLEPISDSYAATITTEIAPVMEEAGLRGGLLYTKKGGTYYHDHQLVLMDAAQLDERSPRSAILFVDANTRIDLLGFSHLDASGKRLSGNCIAQCRYVDPDDADLSARLAGWSTRNLY
ncbi:hypothetical protein ASE85_03390 [Sphingobium sp. Leaf26]|nr:hypothetical protein ASE85_03390 [Sphingobium sp. Leaf26]